MSIAVQKLFVKGRSEGLQDRAHDASFKDYPAPV